MTSKNPVFFMTGVSVSAEEREENMNEVMARLEKKASPSVKLLFQMWF